MNRRRVANGVRSDVPCQQCGRGLAGLGHSVSDNVAQAAAGKSIAFDIDKDGTPSVNRTERLCKYFLTALSVFFPNGKLRSSPGKSRVGRRCGESN
jgi:hypothetical protein